MCSFFSCIVKRDGEVLFDPMSDNHTTILENNGIEDNELDPKNMTFARVEIIPENIGVFSPLSKWKLRIDESITPTWFKSSHKIKALNVFKSFYKEHVFKNKKIKELSEGRYWIKNCTVDKLCGNAFVANSNNSSIGVMCDYSKIVVMRDSSVGEMRNASYIYEMIGSSHVGKMIQSSRVYEMHYSSDIDIMTDFSMVEVMRGSSHVDKMFDYSRIKSMVSSSSVGQMFDSSIVHNVCFDAQIGIMRGRSQICVCSNDVKFSLRQNAIAIIRTNGQEIIAAANKKSSLIHKNKV